MSKKIFLVNCAKYIFALVTVVMVSMAFSACSSDNKDDEPQLKQNALIINGREVAVKEVVCYTDDECIYKIKVFFDNNKMEELRFLLNEKVFFNKVIDLSKKEDTPKYWEVMYDDQAGNRKIDTWSKPDNKYKENEEIYPVFQKGSLFVVKKSDNSIHIKLEGKVDGTDKGAVYDLGFLYEGEMKVVKE